MNEIIGNDRPVYRGHSLMSEGFPLVCTHASYITMNKSSIIEVASRVRSVQITVKNTALLIYALIC